MLLADYQAAAYVRYPNANTLYRVLIYAQMFVQWLENMERVPHNRFSNIIRLPNRLPVKVEVFTPAQYEKLKELSAGTEWYYMIVMAWNTGARYSDCALMQWGNVNLEHCYVNFVPFKSRRTGRAATCPFDAGGDLHQLLLELNSRPRHPHPMWAPYICPFMAMTYPATGDGPLFSRRQEFNALCRKAGAQGLTFHNLRNSFMSRLVQSGVSYPVGSQLTGIISTTVFSRYAAPNLPVLRKAIEDMKKTDEPPPEEGTIISLPAA